MTKFRMLKTVHGVHDGDSREITLEVALARFRTETRGDADDFGAGRRDTACRFGDGIGHRGCRVDVGDKDSHDGPY